MGRYNGETMVMIPAILAAWAAALAQQPSKDILYQGSDPEYALRLPAGYIRETAKETVVSFSRSKGREAWERIYVDVVPLRRPLGKQDIPPAQEFLRQLNAAGIREPHGIRIPWKNLEIDGMEFRFAREGVDMAGRCAWVPVATQAVAVCVSTPSTLAKDLQTELLGVLAVFDARTEWLTDRESASLRMWNVPGYVVPALSASFLLAWLTVFRGKPQRLHGLRVVWHAAVPIVAAVAYFLLQRSAAAREKLGIETPMYLWMLVIAPLAIFHIVMIAHRVRMAIELGD